jgi:hypothetical protein
MKKNGLLILTLISMFFSFGQDIPEVDKIFPGSPEASAFAEYAKVPVQLYNGLVDLNLPLMELTNPNIQIPITISYHSAGNKVDEISSSVGLGWSLNSGGVITRTVRGLHDDDPNGYCGSNQRGALINNTAVTSLSREQIIDFGIGTWDSEPDLYQFNIMGKTGSFTLDPSGNVIMMPENDFKIIPAFGSQSTQNYWTLIDTEGYVYKFGVGSNETETTKITRQSVRSILTTNYPVRQFVSSWYLSSITSPTGDTVQFQYLTGQPTQFVTISERYNSVYGSANGYEITTTTTEILDPVIPNRINSDAGYVRFTTDSRLDYNNGKRIKKLELFNNKNRLIKAIEFKQSYFTSKENCSQEECKRLKLDEVDQYNTTNATEKIKKYAFEYNTLDLPKRGSPEIDHWGYYNANGQTHLIPRSNPMNLNLYRAPNENAAKANILEKVTYESGGYSQFTFGLNDYDSSSTNVVSGALRIEAVESGGNVETPIVVNYTYLKDNSSLSSGVQYSMPVYTQNRTVLQDLGGGFVISATNTVVNSSAYNSLLDLQGIAIGYSNVVTTYPDNSKEVLKYSTLLSNPDTYTSTDFFSINENANITGYINPYQSPFGPPSQDYFYQRGLLKERILLNDLGTEVFHSWNTYNEVSFQGTQQTLGYKFDTNYVLQLGLLTAFEFYASRYRNNNGNYRLTSSIEKTIYDTHDVTVTTNYDYSFERPTLVKTEEMVYGTSDIRETRYTYPHELVGVEQTPHMQNLVNANRISGAIIKEKYRGTTKLYEEHVKYAQSSATDFDLLPIERHEKKGSGSININSTLDRKLVFTKYENGRLVEYRREDDIPVSIIWGYEDLYPIAKIENATNTEVNQFLNTVYSVDIPFIKQTSNFQSGPQSTTLRTWLDNLRNAVNTQKQGTAVTTNTYQRLKGMTSLSDPRGNTSFFEYDQFNRLSFVKDLNEDIIKTYNYNFKNQFSEAGGGNDDPPVPTFGAAVVSANYSAPIPPATGFSSICFTGTTFTKSVQLNTPVPQIGSQIMINGVNATAVWTNSQWGVDYSSGIRWIRFFAHNTLTIYDVNPSTGIITGISSYNCN